MKKLVLITGAAKGLGLAISKVLLEADYAVVGIGRNQTDEFNQLCEEYDNTCFFIPFDLANTEEIKSLVRDITKRHGHLYGLVNNAALGLDGVLATMHEKEIAKLIKVNVEAPVLVAKYSSRSMLLSGKGRIINVGSIIGSTGFSGLSVYGATKAAMEGFSRSLSREVGKARITVNTLAPGYMSTNMTSGLEGDKLSSIVRRSPLGKLATVEDAAHMCKFLMSEEASAVTGAVFTVDAGSTA